MLYFLKSPRFNAATCAALAGFAMVITSALACSNSNGGGSYNPPAADANHNTTSKQTAGTTVSTQPVPSPKAPNADTGTKPPVAVSPPAKSVAAPNSQPAGQSSDSKPTSSASITPTTGSPGHWSPTQIEDASTGCMSYSSSTNASAMVEVCKCVATGASSEVAYDTFMSELKSGATSSVPDVLRSCYDQLAAEIAANNSNDTSSSYPSSSSGDSGSDGQTCTTGVESVQCAVNLAGIYSTPGTH